MPAGVGSWMGRGLLLPLLLATPAPAADPVTTLVPLALEIVNLEYAEAEMVQAPPADAVRMPAVSPEHWYATALFTLPSAGGTEATRTIRVLVRYANGVAAAAWVDRDGDGDLGEESEATLTDFPPLPGARSLFLHRDGVPIPDAVGARDALLVRLVLARAPQGGPPSYRLQRVFAPAGSIAIDGIPRRAVLWDGNLDGRFTDAYGDGIFVDADGDGRLEVDPFSLEFGPFAVPFSLGSRRYRAVPTDEHGRSIQWTDLGPAEPRVAIVPGVRAPSITLRTIDGEFVDTADWSGHPVLLHFWASWCGTCAVQAPDLRGLYTEERDQGLRIVGISQDLDRAACESFIATHALPWPNAFEGRRFWENEAAVAFQVRGAGGMILIAPDGTIDGKYTDVVAVRERVAVLLRTELGRGSR